MKHFERIAGLGVAVVLTSAGAASANTPMKMAGGFDPNGSHAYANDIPVYTSAPASPRSNAHLLVFLRGTGSEDRTDTSQNHKDFFSEAESLGYFVIAPDYFDSDVTPRANCGCDTHCYGYLRNEQFDDSKFSPTGSAKPRDYDLMQPYEALEARLTLILSYLIQHDGSQGWSRFVDPFTGLPQWTNIVVAGHSQGSGLAAFSGKQRHVNAVVMFSGIMDSTNEQGLSCSTSSPTSSVPHWVSDNHFLTNTGTAWATSDLSRYFGIRGRRDNNTTNRDASSAVLQNWNALDLGLVHVCGVDDGYGIVDNNDTYIAKRRRGLYLGSSSDVFSLDAQNQVVLSPSTAPSTDTCGATHTGTVNGDTPATCDNGNASTWPSLKRAWDYVLTEVDDTAPFCGPPAP